MISPASTWFGADALKSPFEQIWGDALRVGMAAEPLGAHQSSHSLLARSGAPPPERAADSRGTIATFVLVEDFLDLSKSESAGPTDDYATSLRGVTLSRAQLPRPG